MVEVWSKFMVTHKIPAVWKYKCLVCWLIIEVTQKFVDMWSTFFSCPICHAWAEWWPIWAEDDIWEYMW